mgnify:CR=1 FL=1
MKKILLSAAAMMAATCAFAQKPLTPPAGGKQISDELIGIFFEDISMSADGGLNAELVQNGSFEYNLTSRTDGDLPQHGQSSVPATLSVSWRSRWTSLSTRTTLPTSASTLSA